MNMRIDMTRISNKNKRLGLTEEIKTKAYQLDSISIIAQGGDLDGLNSEITENLFGLMSNLSREIIELAECSESTEESHA